jgi:hypothetical protein
VSHAPFLVALYLPKELALDICVLCVDE